MLANLCLPEKSKGRYNIYPLQQRIFPLTLKETEIGRLNNEAQSQGISKLLVIQ